MVSYHVVGHTRKKSALNQNNFGSFPLREGYATKKLKLHNAKKRKIMQRKNSKNTTDKLFVPSGALGVVHVSVGEVIIFRPCQGIFHNEKIVMQHGA